MSLAKIVFDSPVFQWTPKDQIPLPSPDADADGIREQNREILNLKKLAYALGIRKIVRVYRKANDDDCAGQYFYSREFRNQQRLLNDWDLSPRQVATVHRELRNGRDVIILDHDMADDPVSVLAHEMGHLINHRLGGLSPFERFSRRTRSTNLNAGIGRCTACQAGSNR